MAYRVDGGCVGVEYLVMGMIDNNVYIVDDGKGCFVVDPTSEPKRILNALGDRTPEAIVLTHFHFDHVGAAAELREATGATVIASKLDAPIIDGSKKMDKSHHGFQHCIVDRVVDEGDTVEVGGMKWQVLMTPGHTPGSMCLFLDPQFGADPSGAPVLVSGDTLFNGAHGRTDFEGSNPADMVVSLKRLAQLPEKTIVLPGHNSMTSIGAEKGWLSRGGFGM